MRGSWPAEWYHNDLLGQTEHIVYVTQEEARQLSQQLQRLIRRYDDRVDHPGHRPPGAMPIEVLMLTYPYAFCPREKPMHPEIARDLLAQRQVELQRRAESRAIVCADR